MSVNFCGFAMRRMKNSLFSVISLVILMTSGCMNLNTAVNLADERRFILDPERNYRITPIAKVNTTLYGFNLLGFPINKIDPTELREEYLKNQNYMVTNWQNIESNIQIVFLMFLFTMPMSKVSFDVVEVYED